MNFKTYLFVLIAILVASCGKSYDDSNLWDEVNSLNKRVEILEKQVSDINAQITSLKSIINALNANLVITSVRETATGYVIVFSDGSSINLNHGKDGMDGRDGKDAPIIGVNEYEGKLYWTITINGNTDWLKDKDGNMIPLTDNTCGSNGADGADGADGITPLINVDEEGYWIISYDNGNTYIYVLDTNGEKVKAKADSESATVPSIIENVYFHTNHITIAFTTGYVVEIPIWTDFYLTFDKATDGIELMEDGAATTIGFTVTGDDGTTFIETCVHGNLDVAVSYDGRTAGSITITRKGYIDADTKILVFLCNSSRTITYVLTFVGYEDSRLTSVVPEDILINVKDHMPIYQGVNPPIIEGSYIADPLRVVYCAGQGNGGYEPGAMNFAPLYVRFTNQNTKNNTLDYEEKEGDISSSVGTGAFISGSGNNFTAFFNREGTSENIYTKTAIVISGTLTGQGIKNFHYAFVMVDKGYDPEPILMAKGVYLIFDDADNLAATTSWRSPQKSRSASQFTFGTKNFMK